MSKFKFIYASIEPERSKKKTFFDFLPVLVKRNQAIITIWEMSLGLSCCIFSDVEREAATAHTNCLVQTELR